MTSHALNPDAVREALEAAGRRCTPQRLAVYDHLSRDDRHPTAEDVYNAVKLSIPNVSLATVYKALETLVACNLASKLTAGDGSARYDARPKSLSPPLPPIRDRPGLAHAVRPRPDRQDRSRLVCNV